MEITHQNKATNINILREHMSSQVTSLVGQNKPWVGLNYGPEIIPLLRKLYLMNAPFAGRLLTAIYSRNYAISFFVTTIQISTTKISFIICKVIAFAVNFFVRPPFHM